MCIDAKEWGYCDRAASVSAKRFTTSFLNNREQMACQNLSKKNAVITNKWKVCCEIERGVIRSGCQIFDNVFHRNGKYSS